MDFLVWYNLIFYIPILFGIIMALGVAGGIGGDADVDMDADVDVDADVDSPNKFVNLDDADVETDSFTAKVFSVLGLGKCPLSIVLLTASLVFGGAGIVLNAFFPFVRGIITVGAAFVVMIFLTGWIAKGVAKIMPSTETYVFSKRSFRGLTGKVTIKVTSSFGQASIRDVSGTLHSIICRSYSGEIPIGKEILVIDYDDQKDVFYVEQLS